MVTGMKKVVEINMLLPFFTEEGEDIQERDTNQLIQVGDEIMLVNQVWRVTSLVEPQKDLTHINFLPVRVKSYRVRAHLLKE